MSPASSSGSGPTSFPCRKTAARRSGRSPDRREHRGAQVFHRRRRERRPRGLVHLGLVREEDGFGIGQGLQAAGHFVVDLEGGHDHARDPRPALEHGRADDVEELSAREPDPFGLRALERAGDRGHARQVRGKRQRPVGAGDPDALRVERHEEPRLGVGGLLALQRVEDGLGVGPPGRRIERRHQRDDPRVGHDDGERPLERRVARLLEGFPGRTGPLQVLGDLRVGDLARAIRGDGDRASDRDQDQERRREEDLQPQRELRRLGRGELQSHPQRRARCGRAGRGRLSTAHRRSPTAAGSPCRTCSCGPAA